VFVGYRNTDTTMEYVNDKVKIVSRGLKAPFKTPVIIKNEVNTVFSNAREGFVTY